MKNATGAITLENNTTYKLFYTLVSGGILNINISGTTVLE